MKVLIDIPDDAESKYIYNSIINKHHIVNDVEIYEQRGLLVRAVRNGIVLDGLTNGDVIKAIFPDATRSSDIGLTNEYGNTIHRTYINGVTDFTADWWNKKWGE